MVLWREGDMVPASKSLEPASIIKSEGLAKYMGKNQETVFLNQKFLPI